MPEDRLDADALRKRLSAKGIAADPFRIIQSLCAFVSAQNDVANELVLRALEHRKALLTAARKCLTVGETNQ